MIREGCNVWVAIDMADGDYVGSEVTGSSTVGAILLRIRC